MKPCPEHRAVSSAVQSGAVARVASSNDSALEKPSVRGSGITLMGDAA